MYLVKQENSIPASWVITTLAEVCEINPKTDFSHLDDGDEISFVPMPFVEELTGKLNPNNFEKVGKIKKGYTRFRNGDVLFAKITPCMENGKIAIAEHLKKGIGAGSTEFHVFRPYSGVCNRFVLYYLLQMAFRHDAQHHMSGAVGQKRVPLHYLYTSQIPLPPANEQERIVDKIEALFSDVDKGEALLEQVQRQLFTYRQSVLKAAVSGELTEEWRKKNKHHIESGEVLLQRILKSRRENWKRSGQYKIGSTIKDQYFKVPNGWGIGTLEMVSHRVTDGTHQSPKFEKAGIPFVVIGDVHKGVIDWPGVSKWVSFDTYEENTKRCKPEKDDILYTAVGSYGICLKIRDEKPFMFQRHIAHIKPIKDFGSIDFIVAVLNSPISLARAHKVARGVAQKTVTLGDLSQFQIPIPSVEEQDEIMNRLNDVISQIDALENWCATELQRSNTLRQSILKSAFTGKLVPQAPVVDEPASALLARIQSMRAQSTVAAPARRGRKSKASEAA